MDASIKLLFEAAKSGNMELIKKAISDGADVNAKDEDGNDALVYAYVNGHKDIVRFLLEHGADDYGGTVRLILEEGEDNPNELLQKANDYLSKGRNFEALIFYDKLKNVFAKNQDVWVGKSLSLFKMNQHYPSACALETALELKPDLRATLPHELLDNHDEFFAKRVMNLKAILDSKKSEAELAVDKILEALKPYDFSNFTMKAFKANICELVNNTPDMFVDFQGEDGLTIVFHTPHGEIKQDLYKIATILRMSQM